MPFLIAVIASAAVILSSPFIGGLQSALRDSLSTRAYVAGLGIAVGGAIAAAIAIAFLRVRQRRVFRVTVMAASLAIGALYVVMLSTGDATIDAVERVHFVQYGAIAVLFYRASRGAGDPSALIVPVLCGVAVGILDEWLQWFIPYRVGETKDVFLNVTAIVCGLLFGVALDPPESWSWSIAARGRRRIAIASAAAVLLFARFVNDVHLGYEHQAEGIGRFKSRYTMHELEALQRERDVRWRTAPPVGISRLSREDQYLDEALWHVRERNRRWDAGEITTAFHENLILERFFTPVLDRETYVSPTGTRWAPAHRADADARRASAGDFVSQAEPRVILAWSKTAYWIAATLVAAWCVATGFRVPRDR